MNIHTVREGLAVSAAPLNAYHPSLVCLDERSWVLSYDRGSSFDALDYHTRLLRTRDGGGTWECGGRILPADGPTTHTIRISRLKDGRLIGFGKMEDRRGYDTRCNRETLGQAPMRLFFILSGDAGKSWTGPRFIDPPLEGPTWELCHPILELPDGRWGAPVATWADWHGRLPNGHRTVILISGDEGASWPEYGCSFDGSRSGLIHWEQSVVRLPDAGLLAVAWAYDPRSGETLPSVCAGSADAGKSFSAPQPTGFLAQTCKLLALGGNRVAAAYRRHDQPGLWLELAEIREGQWHRIARQALWTGADSGMHAGDNPAESLRSLTFGYPSLARLDDHSFALAYWRTEGAQAVVRWMVLAPAEGGADLPPRTGPPTGTP